ncbi:hypothetical protein LTR56_025534 [Elasticomyces elasticus]|nr:hypothetical protein LTR56_025534 [Elasticomyces elasticus]KAK3627376.1 hypothetical protein LTR22_022760 [Elasticomyces elasticus]KAK4907364.1 hypothetical protein LTR49_023600 [Elasticomyces elasticus]KAK5740075.1 hypothetical protein LTS12_025054 [Elasticomyces elasticus]
MLSSGHSHPGPYPNGLHPIDEEDGIDHPARSVEEKYTGVGGQSRFTCERCGQGFTERRSLTRHQTRAKRCPDAGFHNRVEPSIRNDQRTQMPYSAAGRNGGLSDKNSNIVSRGMQEPGHAYLEGEPAYETYETGRPDLRRSFISASGTGYGPRSRTSSTEGHDSGVELQLGISADTSADLYNTQEVDYALAADIPMPLVPMDEQVPLLAIMDDAMTQGDVDILQYDWHRDPEKYLLINLDELVETQVVSLDGNGTIISQYESDHPHERPTTPTSDAVSVRSTSSRRSIISMPGRSLASYIRSPSSNPQGRSNMILKVQWCSVCKKPYEQDIVSLRAHLSRHLDEFRAAETVPTCDICEIGFATQLDLDWHLHNAKRSQPGQCCGLPAGHEQPCKGYRCGFDFKHDRPCNGHHPPSDGGLAWTEYDRFKFGQFLRKWERNQVRVVRREAKNVEHLRSFKFAFDNLSLPEFRRLSRLSGISKLSWRSEPVGNAFDMHDLRDSLQTVALNGLLQRTARRLAGTQKTVDDDLLNAASANDINSVLSLLRRGATPGAALSVAIEQDNSDMIVVLFQAGARVELGLLFQAVSAGQAHVAKQLLNHRSCTFVPSHGAVLLQLAIRSASQDTLFVMLSFVGRAAVDQKPSEIQLIDYAKSIDHNRAEGGSTLHHPAYRDMTRDPALCVATCLGHVWAISCLLDAGANPDVEGVDGTALGYAINERPECVAVLLSGKNHIRYERCYEGNGAIELAVTKSAFSVLQLLLDRCRADDESSCEHGKRALKAYLKAPSPPLLSVLMASQVEINDAIYDFGETALHFVARTRVNDTALTGLLRAGADLRKTDTLGYTALDHAIRTRNIQTIRLLLDAGAAQYSKGYHALLSAGSTLKDAAEDEAIVRMLAACGLDVNALDSDGYTPLYRACQLNRTIATDALFQAGANPTCRAIHAAIPRVTAGSLQCIHKLVAAGADLNQMDEHNCSPLERAARYLHAEAFEQLIDAGANITGFSIQDLDELMCKRPRISAAPLLRSLFAYNFPVLQVKNGNGKSILHRAAANGDIGSILILGAADSYASRGKLNSLLRVSDRMLSEPQHISHALRTTMSTAVFEVLYFELTANDYRPAHDFRIRDLRSEGSLSTRYAVCEALLRFQPEGLEMGFSFEVVMALIRQGTAERGVANKFMQLILQKSYPKLTPELTSNLMQYAIDHFTSEDSTITETIRVLLDSCETALPPALTMTAVKSFLKRVSAGDLPHDGIALLLRRCGDKAGLSLRCDWFLGERPNGYGLKYTKLELRRRIALMRSMAEEGFRIPTLDWCGLIGGGIYEVEEGALTHSERTSYSRSATEGESFGSGMADPTTVAFQFSLR